MKNLEKANMMQKHGVMKNNEKDHEKKKKKKKKHEMMKSEAIGSIDCLQKAGGVCGGPLVAEAARAERTVAMRSMTRDLLEVPSKPLANARWGGAS